MMVIEQECLDDLEVDIHSNVAWIDNYGDSICIDKKGAAQLIKVLQEWIDEN